MKRRGSKHFKFNGWSGGRTWRRGHEEYYLCSKAEQLGAVSRSSQQEPWRAWVEDGLLGLESDFWRRCDAKRWVEAEAARRAR